MNELELLEAWNFIKEQMPYFTHSHLVSEMNENSDIVEQALLKLKTIENAEPSEALEDLENLRCNLYNKPYLERNALSDFNTIKQALLKAQEQEKVLEIINNIIKFGDDLSVILNFDTYEKYSEWSWDYELTQEEFELLKRWLG